jgi:hypothetical protein
MGRFQVAAGDLEFDPVLRHKKSPALYFVPLTSMIDRDTCNTFFVEKQRRQVTA